MRIKNPPKTAAYYKVAVDNYPGGLRQMMKDHQRDLLREMHNTTNATDEQIQQEKAEKKNRYASGKREDLDNRFFRSSWEANFARYLNLMIERKQRDIASWEYEPQEFWFHEIQRGTRSYLPDFKVHFTDGEYHWYELKGWMDNVSKTKLKRFAKYYPEEADKLSIIGKTEYNNIMHHWSKCIPNWEFPNANK